MTSSWYLNDRLFAFGFGAGRCTILDDGFNGIFLVKVGMWFAFFAYVFYVNHLRSLLLLLQMLY